MEDTPQENKPIGAVPRVRTFSNDIQSAVQDGNISKVNIVMAERKRDRENGVGEENQKRNAANIGLIVGYVFVILLFIAGGVGIFIFFQSNQNATNSTLTTAPQDNTLLRGNPTTELLIEEEDNRPQISNKINAALSNITEDSFVRINLTALILDEYDVRMDEALSLESLFARLSISDDGFSRLVDSYVFGVDGGRNPFLLIKVSDSDESYGRLFSWESRMATDLSALFPQLLLDREEIPRDPTDMEETNAEVDTGADIGAEESMGGVTTDTSEEPNGLAEEVPGPEYRTIFNPISATFTDRVFYNFDSRAIYDVDNNVRLIYSFITRDLVVIASTPETLLTISTELKNTTITR